MAAAECEAVLLGREAIHGSANATALANLVKMLMRRCDLQRKYILRCSRDHGLQMIPNRRVEDEGFESDEDLTSLGSYDSATSMYVSDHAVPSKCHTSMLAATGLSSQIPSGTEATSSSISSVGTDSANSSGASDNDDTDNSLNHNVNRKAGPDQSKKLSTNSSNSSCSSSNDSQQFAFHEVAFCHTDPLLPKVIVWVVKTKQQSCNSSNFSYGLEAFVFLCHQEDKFRALYRNFQECSRRQKLEKPMRSHGVVVSKTNSHSLSQFKKLQPVRPAAEKQAVVGNKNSALMFNLIQRVDVNGVTHIEVARPVCEVRQPRVLIDEEPSSIISINTPDSGDINGTSKLCDRQIESVIKTEKEEDRPPERPERRKGRSSSRDKCGTHQVSCEKVVKGQFVRVNVDPKVSSQAAKSGWLFCEAKPCTNVLSYPSQLVWCHQAEVDAPAQTRKSRKEMDRVQRHRSKSSVILRRSESPKRVPMSHRYVDTVHINNSLPNRFFGRLRELTGASLQPRSRRRNSIGDLTNPNYYHGSAEKRFDKNAVLAKSTPNLKSMIKNKNGKYCKDGYNDNEPKKVTFSAYTTVQVVN